VRALALARQAPCRWRCQRYDRACGVSSWHAQGRRRQRNVARQELDEPSRRRPRLLRLASAVAGGAAAARAGFELPLERKPRWPEHVVLM
jgi:hypothetical protein